MQKYMAKKIMLQSKILNRLLEDPSTPRGKLLIELMLLNSMLDNFDQDKASTRELETMTELLRKTRLLIDKNKDKLEAET